MRYESAFVKYYGEIFGLKPPRNPAQPFPFSLSLLVNPDQTLLIFMPNLFVFVLRFLVFRANRLDLAVELVQIRRFPLS